MKNNLPLAWIGALGAWLGVGLIWVLVAKFTNYELSIIVVGVGVAAGSVLAHLLEDIEPSRETAIQHGILATLATIVAILAVRFAMWQWVFWAVGNGFREFLLNEFSVIDRGTVFSIIFYGASLYTAYITAFSSKDPASLEKAAQEEAEKANTEDSTDEK